MDNGQCKEYVYHRDVPRYCGGKRKFKMHYNRKQCKRKAVKDGLCYQHQPDYWLKLDRRKAAKWTA